MRVRPRLLDENRFTGQPVADVERVLAVGRAFLTVTGFVAIYLDPTEPARLREITYAVLFLYALYSLAVLAHVQGRTRLSRRHVHVLHGLDILWTSVLTFVSEGPVSPFFLYFLFVVVAAAYRWGFRETVGTALLTFAVFLVETAVAAAGPWSLTFAPMTLELNRTIIRGGYLLLTGVLLGYLARQQKESLRAHAAAAERARVARELHDGAIQSLFGVEMKLEAIRRELPHSDWPLDAELAEIQSLLRSEVMALRELMQALRPLELDSGDLSELLAGIVERFRRDTGISARFLSSGGPVTLPAPRALEILRIVQEALVNVRKHSQARNVLVRLAAANGDCSLVVEDDGRGFPFEGRLSAAELASRRLGPVVIRERARLAAVQLAIESSPGAGARVELTFREAS
ncbi:MAG: hypothetical protein HYU37_17275 [Acidobacteria bacterium]|nr:hypothetical protein [Acidobacteriota bacterium]